MGRIKVPKRRDNKQDLVVQPDRVAKYQKPNNSLALKRDAVVADKRDRMELQDPLAE